MIVHNETSTACVTHPLDVRKIMDRVGHPALFMVDTISGLGSLEYEHDAWGIDVSVAGSQKGLMLPPGLGFNAVSEKGACGSEGQYRDALLLGLAGSYCHQQGRHLALYAGDQSPVRLERGDRDARRRRARERL